MTVYTTSQARERLADVLNDAERDGSVRIRRDDGREFDVVPIERGASPLDVAGAGLDLSTEDVLNAIREGRER
ncbi:type II toxin-antitoxin system Phd/YefM family antitoxin [Rubrivirga sp. IMCC45206]|uniref:type II toxin-antitoxin system Phd/YefM family antitoxin n=1 Tax=Rubrivirga sp. IMCC45206 TaxID=3391614 RepID=UPI00398FC8A4